MQIALAALIATILGTLVLLMLFGFLAALIPALRYAFLLMIILIPWIIYVNIRRYVGRLWWFIQIASRRSTLSSDIMT
jgi:hypothetical protein